MRKSMNLALAGALAVSAFASTAAGGSGETLYFQQDCGGTEGAWLSATIHEDYDSSCGGIPYNTAGGLLLSTSTSYFFQDGQGARFVAGDVITGQIVIDTYGGIPGISETEVTVEMVKGEDVVGSVTFDAGNMGSDQAVAEFELPVEATVGAKDVTINIVLTGVNVMSGFVSHTESFIVLP